MESHGRREAWDAAKYPENDPAPNARGAEVGGGVTEEEERGWASGCIRKAHDEVCW